MRSHDHGELTIDIGKKSYCSLTCGVLYTCLAKYIFASRKKISEYISDISCIEEGGYDI